MSDDLTPFEKLLGSEKSNNSETSQNVNMPQELKNWAVQIGNAQAEASGKMNCGASTVCREAVFFYRAFYHVRTKAAKYKEAVIALLESLP